jgi:hypothetical protein
MLLCSHAFFVVLHRLGALLPGAPFDHGGNPRADITFHYRRRMTVRHVGRWKQGPSADLPKFQFLGEKLTGKFRLIRG